MIIRVAEKGGWEMKKICESAWIFAVLVLFLMFLTPLGLNAIDFRITNAI